jgi:peptide/nickel transport system permease protein
MLIGGVITLAVVLAVVLGPALSPYQPGDMDFLNVLSPPGWAHPMGTDSFGRDVLVRVMAGGRISLIISVLGVGIGAVLGAGFGMAASWCGGWVESAIMAVADLLFAFPSFVLALFMMVVLGFGLQDVIIAIAVTYLPIFCRLARNLSRLLLGEPFVQSARLMGQSAPHIMLREILPNILPALLVQFSVGLAFGIVMEAGLSFLGLGVQPPTPSLGVIMADGREYFGRAPWVLTMTGLMVSAALLGLNLLGDGLRDLSDPRLRGSGP